MDTESKLVVTGGGGGKGVGGGVREARNETSEDVTYNTG